MSDRSRVLLADPDPTHRVRLTGTLALAGSGLGAVSVVSGFASAASIVDAVDRAFASLPTVALPTAAEGRTRMEPAP